MTIHLLYLLQTMVPLLMVEPTRLGLIVQNLLEVSTEEEKALFMKGELGYL